MIGQIDPYFNSKSYAPRMVPPLELVPNGYVKIKGEFYQAYKIERAKEYY